MQEKIKRFRLEIDTIINSIGMLNSSREVSLCYTSLQRGKMWLGKALGALGTPTPYPVSSDPFNPTIEPQADHDNVSFAEAFANVPSNQTARVKCMRSIIQDYLKFWHKEKIDKFPDGGVNPEMYDLYIFMEQSYLAMHEANMWLGWELDRIRKEIEWVELGCPTRNIPPLLPLQ